MGAPRQREGSRRRWAPRPRGKGPSGDHGPGGARLAVAPVAGDHPDPRHVLGRAPRGQRGSRHPPPHRRGGRATEQGGAFSLEVAGPFGVGASRPCGVRHPPLRRPAWWLRQPAGASGIGRPCYPGGVNPKSIAAATLVVLTAGGLASATMGGAARGETCDASDGECVLVPPTDAQAYHAAFPDFGGPEDYVERDRLSTSRTPPSATSPGRTSPTTGSTARSGSRPGPSS